MLIHMFLQVTLFLLVTRTSTVISMPAPHPYRLLDLNRQARLGQQGRHPIHYTE